MTVLDLVVINSFMMKLLWFFFVKRAKIDKKTFKLKGGEKIILDEATVVDDIGARGGEEATQHTCESDLRWLQSRRAQSEVGR